MHLSPTSKLGYLSFKLYAYCNVSQTFRQSTYSNSDIKLQDGMTGIDYILCKQDLNLIRRLA